MTHKTTQGNVSDQPNRAFASYIHNFDIRMGQTVLVNMHTQPVFTVGHSALNRVHVEQKLVQRRVCMFVFARVFVQLILGTSLNLSV